MALLLTVTDTGWTKLLDAVNAGQALQLTEVALGSVKHAVDPAEQALTAEEERVSIGSSSVDPGAKRLTLNIAAQSEAEYEINELGVFDVDGDLIFVWAAEPGADPLALKSAGVQVLIGASVQLSAAPVEAIEIVDQGQPLELSLEPMRQSFLGLVLALANESTRQARWEAETILKRIGAH